MVHNHLKGFWPLVDICLGLFSQVPTGYKIYYLFFIGIRKRLLIGTNESTSVTTRVGFTAVTTDHQMNMGMDQTVQFPKIITNIGNGFDSLTGIFRAPVPGLYLFSASILSHAGNEVRCQIVHNGEGLVFIFAGDTATYSTGAKSIVLDLVKNDEVWIK